LPRVSSGGGGDEGEFAENSTYLKLPENSDNLVLPKSDTMKKGIKIGEVMQGIQPP
jgi:predicted RNA-binding protein (virulence factor B family)